MLPYFFAIGSNIAFSWASVAFAYFSNKISPLWMNAFKSTAAFVAFAIAYTFWGSETLPEQKSIIAFMLSGFLGLNIGDWFLLYTFSKLGASRTLMLYSFQPLILGTAGYFLFGQTLGIQNLFAIVFLIACLVVISLENYKRHGHWNVQTLLIGFLAIALDGIGIILTRYGFENSPANSAIDANFFRCFGAVLGFSVLAFLKPLHIAKNFFSQTKRDRGLIIAASLSGTFLSLFLYLSAVQKGHLATIAAISITSPLFAGAVESVVQRKPPSLYLVISFCLFVCGFLILTLL